MRKQQTYCHVIFKHFTKGFVKEYLVALQQTHSYSIHKNRSATCTLKVSDLVLIKEDFIPRLSWKKGIVHQVITGHDGAVRGASIRTRYKNTFIKQLLQLIVLLEADQLQTKQQEPAHEQFGSNFLQKKKNNSFKLLTSFAKVSILDV